MSEDGLRDLLLTLSPMARDNMRRVLVLDQPDRDAIASELLRYGDANGDGWADVIDTLTMYPDARRKVVRLCVQSRRAHETPPTGSRTTSCTLRTSEHRVMEASQGQAHPAGDQRTS